MNLNDLPNEIVTRCFSLLSTELLIDIILLENIPDNILHAAANNLNHLWYSERIQGIQRVNIEVIECIEGIEAYYETDFDRFLRIHKILDEKSLKCPLWFNYTWNNIHEMHKSLDEINLAYNGQKLGIHADIHNPAFEIYPIFSDHDINLKITCLSLNTAWSRSCVDLNDFPKLETFYGVSGKMEVDYDHPSLKNVYLSWMTFSTLPINLIKLVAKDCVITMNENHPKLEALTVLALEDTRRPSDCSAIIRVLWNKDLEHFSYIGEGAIDEDEIISMVGPKVTSLGFSGSISAKIPSLLSSLYSSNNDGLTNLTAFTHMTSLSLRRPSDDINNYLLPPKLLNLKLDRPKGEIDRLKFPPSLVKLSIRNAKFKDLAKVDFPSNLVDLKLEYCRITLTVGWLKPARLKRLSLARNNLSSFHAVLPCCEFLRLSDNTLTEIETEAPVLEHIDLTKNKLTSIPKLPARLQVLILSNNRLDLSQMSELPPNLKRLDLHYAGTGAFQNYTFPSSLEQLSLEANLDLSHMSGVKFAQGSRLRELNMSGSRLRTINDRKIELPFGLKSLQLGYNYLRHINTLTIPQTVTSLGLQRNTLKSLKVKSHIETLYLNENRLSSLTIPKDLELKYLDLKLSGLEKFSFDLFGAERLTQLRLGPEFKVIDVSKMPVSFQILEFPGSNSFEIEGLHRYPESDIWRRFL